jgi:hypothetical protein
MPRRADEVSPRDRQLRRGAWAVSIIVLGLLLFAWPFLRTPPLGIGGSYAHLLAAWALVIVALALLSRALARSGGARGDRA